MNHLTPITTAALLAAALAAGCASTGSTVPSGGGTAAATQAPVVATAGPSASADAGAPNTPARADERRSDQPFTVNLFDRPTQLRLGYELSLERRGNFDLNVTRDRNRRIRDQELKVEARMRASERLTLMAEAVLLSEVRRQKATGTVQRTNGTQRGQLWAQLDRLGGLPLAVQAGRIPLVDRRAWWWDEDLDAVRLISSGDTWRVETGFGRELARKASFDPGIDIANRGVRRWFGQASWNWQRRHALEAFWLGANDRSGTPVPGSLVRADDVDAIDARLGWLGLRASGGERTGAGHRYTYWADIARVSGRQAVTAFGADTGAGQLAGATTNQRVRGKAIDVGAQWTWDVAFKPTLTAAWAHGSGSAEGALVDGNFRQTGLQENKTRFAGVKRLQRYGELLDPELSNLQVGTVGAGLRVLDNTSIELVWHRYRQLVPSTALAGSRLSQAPEGLNGDIGHEVDFFIAWREWRELELTLALSRFTPGSAFAANRRHPATGIELGLALNF